MSLRRLIACMREAKCSPYQLNIALAHYDKMAADRKKQRFMNAKKRGRAPRDAKISFDQLAAHNPRFLQETGALHEIIKRWRQGDV